jgi:hypothetical protein
MTYANSKIAKVGLALSVAAAMTATAVPMTASAQTGVFRCDAPGSKQESGAVIGALLGGLLGNQVARNERTAGTVVGAGLGAAAGSYIGCKSQTQDDYGRGVYSRDGQRLANYVLPARYERTNMRMTAVTNVSLRAGPSTSTARVGSLQRGQTFQAAAYANGGQWVLVSRDGVGVGYVHAGYVRPISGGYQRTGYGYQVVTPD